MIIFSWHESYLPQLPVYDAVKQQKDAEGDDGQKDQV